MNKRGFTRFEFKIRFERISYTATTPKSCEASKLSDYIVKSREVSKPTDRLLN